MSDPDLQRYARQVVLPEVGVHGQQVLCDSSALIIGVGGLGSAAALYLAGGGVGRLLLCDRDRVALSNLQRQILYTQADLGKAKAATAAARIQALNPQVQVTPVEGRLTEAGLDAMAADADVVLDCSDNFPTRFAVNRACVRQRRALVSAAAIRWGGQLAVFDLRRGGPCYACLYPEPGTDAERCEDAGILGPVAGTMGSLQALAALRLLLGNENDAGKLLTWDAKGMEWNKATMTQDPQCPVCGPQR